MKKIYFSFLLLLAISSRAQQRNAFDVRFDTDKYDLTVDATTSLDSFINVNKNNVKIKLYGHCDIMADFDYNDQLSLKRTHAVKKYLIKKGYAADNIIEEKGFGKRRPLNNNRGEKEMFLNRRVEIVVNGDDLEETVVATKTLTQQMTDTFTKPGKAIVLKNMNFYGGTHVIMPQSMPVLTELIEIMKKNPTLEIAVEGHICCQAGDSDGIDMGTRTRDLSVNRAREICAYLNQNGIASKRLQYKGFGHQFPLVSYPEKTEEERTQNRRVEIKILKK